MSYETILVTRANQACVVTLNRPESRNAITTRMMTELAAALLEAETDDSCRAVILTGGMRCFSSGRDLKEASTQTAPGDFARGMKLWRTLTQTMEQLARPVIAAIEGPCLTGGLELALACDLRVAGEGASFGITSARLGTVPAFGATQRLPRLIGAPRALELLFSAEPIGTEEAYRIGLLNRRAPAGNALAEAQSVADVYSERAPLSLAAIKKAVYRGSEMDLSAALDFEIATGSTLLNTADRKEGVAAFLEKRKPRFQGR
jgi:enoyl-CoA hydratase/carnithine racemase